ncbi:MAG: hypothetical protein NC930_00620 [Candidatus Omnitrophica bacterium]|nr:hypothetical protein [Candidatus Omnitrophota bacterium]
MDDTDRLLVTYLERGLPFVSKPFEVLGGQIGIDGAETILRILRLKDAKVFRQLTALFDGKKLGYQSALVAMRVPESRMDHVAGIVNRHPGVVRNYSCRFDFNLWFLLALPGQDSLNEHVGWLQELTGIEQAVIQPVVQVFKSEGGDNFLYSLALGRGRTQLAKGLSALEIEVIRILGQDLPLVDMPYLQMARTLGITEHDFYKMIQSLTSRGYLRRFGIFPDYWSLEQSGNYDHVIFRVPEERLDSVGQKMALIPEIFFCFRSQSCAEFPYSLHAMAAHRREGDSIMEKIQDQTGSWPGTVLVVEKNYKTMRVQFFPKELEEWQSRKGEIGFLRNFKG